MKKFLSLVLFLTLTTTAAFAQVFILDSELRPKFEYRNGYRSPIDENTAPGASISQRSRVNLTYNSSILKTYISLQNIKTWGDTRMSNSSDVNGTMIHQAWGEISLSPAISLKIGRQPLRYNDQRLFGYNNSSQQARTHDAFLFKYTPSSDFTLHIGATYNQDRVTDTGNFYALNDYKTFQFLWANYKIGDFDISLVFNNDGRAYAKTPEARQKTVFNQTFGPFIEFNKDKLRVVGAAYFQTGKNANNIDKSAWFAHLETHYNFTPAFKVGLGCQILSGKSMTDTCSKDLSFDKLYGAGHAFNGTMDYFYAGSSHGQGGLIDLFMPMSYKYKKLTLSLNSHYFWSHKDVIDVTVNEPDVVMPSNLGFEADFALAYKFSENITFEAGYSQIFATKTLRHLKGKFDLDASVAQNWIWGMITIKPQLFKFEK